MNRNNKPWGRSFGGKCLLVVIAVVSPEASAMGQETDAARSASTTQTLRNDIVRAAFDPARFFDEESRLPPILSISYTGDDWGWPVYSIAVRQGCRLRGPREPGCGSRRIARMVRAPENPESTRPRHRGSALVARVAAGGKPLPAALHEAGLEWLEADLAKCPAAEAIFGQAGAIEWVPRQNFIVDEDAPLNIILHADQVEVTFNTYARGATYRGYIADRSPAAWAVKFADALEGCWTRSEAVPPWRRQQGSKD